MRRVLSTLALALALTIPAAAWAVATNVDVRSGGERVANKRIQIVDTSTNQVVAEPRTDDSGRATVDLAAGTYVARSEDGQHRSKPFQAGDTAKLEIPAYGKFSEGWDAAIDIGGGWSGMESDTSANGNQVTEHVREIQVQDPIFPDRFTTQQQLVRMDNPFAFDSGDSVSGGFGGATVQLMGPPCGPCGIRPLFFGGFSFNKIGSTLIDQPVDSTGSNVKVSVKRYPWQLGLGAGWETPWWGIGVEGSVVYQNDYMELTGSFNPKDSTSFHVHSIGPRINVTKSLMKWDKAELGVFAGVSVLFPFAGEDETLTLVGSNGSAVRFDYEAKTMVTAGGGVRLSFDIPGL
jgi:hypothetical protein